MSDDEFERVSELAQIFAHAAAGPNSAVLRGIGDDAAVLRAASEPWVLSVDTAVEHVHFERSFASWAEIGARAFTAAISDLAAMGAAPAAALCSLIVPSSLSATDFTELNNGIARAAADYGCPVVGGNMSATRTQEASITTTVVGRLLEGTRGLFRDAARPGDDVYITGPLGSAALGLLLLQRTAAELGPAFVTAWRSPRARIAEGLQLAACAHAAIDVSDGALQDLAHICSASHLGAELEAARIPFAPDFEALARQLGADPLELALLGGEDYELIYTVPRGVEPALGTRIGRMLEGPGPVRVLDEQGAQMDLKGRAYRHF